MADFYNYHHTNEKEENSNYSLDDFKRFLNGMQEVVGQVEREHKELAEALRENRNLREELDECKNNLGKALESYESAKKRLEELEHENFEQQLRIVELKRSRTEIKNIYKMKKDGDAVLAVLLQAYKELDETAMTKFEAEFSQLNDDSDHRFQQQLDRFRKVHKEKSKEKKQATVMNIDNRGGYAFLDSELKGSKFIR